MNTIFIFYFEKYLTNSLLKNLLFIIILDFLSIFLTHRSPAAPASAAPSGAPGVDPVLRVEILPKICNKMTQPIYATLNNKIAFGLILNPSASSPKNDMPSFGFNALLLSGLRPDC